jgi:hypothetical protein
MVGTDADMGVHEWYAGQAFVDLYNDVALEKGAAPTLLDLVTEIGKMKSGTLNFGIYTPASGSADRTDGYEAGDPATYHVGTFIHGFYWGRGSSSMGANHSSVGAQPAFFSNRMGSYNGGNNSAYIFVPTDRSISALCDMIIDSRDYPDASISPALKTAVKSFLIASGINPNNRYMEPLQFAWGYNGDSPMHVPPYLPVQNSTTIPASPISPHPHPILGGQFRRPDGKMMALPFAVEAYVASHAATWVRFDAAETSYTPLLRFITAGSNGTGFPANSIPTASVSLGDLSPARVLSGQPWGRLYNTTTGDLLPSTLSGSDLLSGELIARRATMTMEVDRPTTGLEMSLFQIDGENDTGLLTSYQAANAEKYEAGITQYDTVTLTLRKLVRICLDAVHLGGLDVSFDTPHASLILSGKA